MFTLALLALSGVASALTVNTPASLVQCQPIKITWAEGTAPYYLTVVPGGQASAAPLVSFPKSEATEQTWTVNQPAGTSLTIMLTDGTGTQAFTSPITVQASSDDSCMKASSSAETATEQETGAATEEPSASETPASQSPSPSSSAATTTSSAAASSSAPASSASSAASSAASSVSSKASSAASSASAAASSAAPTPTSGASRVAVGGFAAAAAGLIALAAF